MSSSAILLPWQFNVGNLVHGTPTLVSGLPKFPPEYLTATQGQNSLFFIKQALKGTGTWTNLTGAAATATGNWGVRSSCDGSGGAGSFGNNDNVDRWVSAANLIASAAGNHSWIVLTQPGLATNFEVVIDLNVNSTPGSATIAVSPNKRFGSTGGFGGTDGSATARPTALDEIVLINAASWGTGVTGDAYGTGDRIHVLKSADGSATRVLICRSGFIAGLWCFERPEAPLSAWDHPSISMVLATSSVNPTDTIANQTNLVQTASFKGRTKDYPNGAAFSMFLAEDSWFSAFNVNSSPVPNELDGTIPFYTPSLLCLTVGTRGRYGNMKDAWFVPWTCMDGMSLPNDGTRQWVMMGRLAIPWNLSVNLWH